VKLTPGNINNQQKKNFNKSELMLALSVLIIAVLTTFKEQIAFQAELGEVVIPSEAEHLRTRSGFQY